MDAPSIVTATRDWDEYDAYLFDIDGTLIRCMDEVHHLAFCEALAYLADRSLGLEGVNMHGNTDRVSCAMRCVLRPSPRTTGVHVFHGLSILWALLWNNEAVNLVSRCFLVSAKYSSI